jgi:hypothetical protein
MKDRRNGREEGGNHKPPPQGSRPLYNERTYHPKPMREGEDDDNE